VSKLIEKLKKTSQESSQPMGFGAARLQPQKPKIQLVAWLTADALSPAAASGADGVILEGIKASSKAVKAAAQTFGEIPWGILLKENGKDVNSLVTAGCDFLVFPSNIPVSALDNKAGKIFVLDPSLPEGMLRSLGVLEVDVVLPDKEFKDITWQDLMQIRYLGGTAGKSLLLSVSEDITAAELKALWEVGVTGVVLKGGDIKKLRQIIDGTPFPSRRKHKGMDAMVPQMRQEAAAPPEEEEEEEEDD
jgi:hypothetical protein